MYSPMEQATLHPIMRNGFTRQLPVPAIQQDGPAWAQLAATEYTPCRNHLQWDRLLPEPPILFWLMPPNQHRAAGASPTCRLPSASTAPCVQRLQFLFPHRHRTTASAAATA